MIATVLAAWVCLGAAGCARKAPLTLDQIKARYAQRLARGLQVGMTYIEADRVDPRTHDLIHVRIEGKGGLFAADRGEILVDTVDNTVRLRLVGVVGAMEEQGAVIDLGSLTTDPIPLDRTVVDAPPAAVEP
ncbi:MAG: hypothetical protein D6824_01600 [Planctomycetota bacterium]|nr:MAG: hypothetical protein D6824_01600 [Planctomycetota bacterium]